MSDQPVQESLERNLKLEKANPLESASIENPDGVTIVTFTKSGIEVFMSDVGQLKNVASMLVDLYQRDKKTNSRLDEGGDIDKRIDATWARADNAHTKIADEASARASQDSALSGRISTAQSAADGARSVADSALSKANAAATSTRAEAIARNAYNNDVNLHARISQLELKAGISQGRAPGSI